MLGEDDVAAAELVGGEHRLVVLVLVLQHHAVDEAAVGELLAVVETHRVQRVEHLAPHQVDVAGRLCRGEQRQGGAHGARVLEGVVQRVDLRPHRARCPPRRAAATAPRSCRRGRGPTRAATSDGSAARPARRRRARRTVRPRERRRTRSSSSATTCFRSSGRDALIVVILVTARRPGARPRNGEVVGELARPGRWPSPSMPSSVSSSSSAGGVGERRVGQARAGRAVPGVGRRRAADPAPQSAAASSRMSSHRTRTGTGHHVARLRVEVADLEPAAGPHRGKERGEVVVQVLDGRAAEGGPRPTPSRRR